MHCTKVINIALHILRLHFGFTMLCYGICEVSIGFLLHFNFHFESICMWSSFIVLTESYKSLERCIVDLTLHNNEISYVV